MWELLARPCMEYAVVWWTGGCSAFRKLEPSQMNVDRRLLGASNRVAGVAVQWRSRMEEAGGDDEMKVLFGKRS